MISLNYNMVQLLELNDIKDDNVIHLSKDDNSNVDEISLNDNQKKSTNFGSGIELLMNDKRKSDKQSTNNDIELGDLNDLENELNNLTFDTKNQTSENKQPSKSGLFNNSIKDIFKLNTDDNEQTTGDKPEQNADIPLGKDTANANVTEDGFKKFTNIPIDPDKIVNQTQKLSHEDMLKEKFGLLRKLEALESKGVKLTKKYNMDSNYLEMKGEYEMIVFEKERSNSVKFQGKMMMAAITGVEFLNNRFDPFDIKLDGWSEQLNENIDDYDEIFGELHDKYKSKAKMAPELKLMFQMAGSAIMVHMTNTMFKSAMPGMDDIMKQNPELMQQFTQAAVNTMGEQNPGFGGFMNNVVGGGRQRGQSNNDDAQAFSAGPPPQPMKTRTDKSNRAHVPDNRPDMAAARGSGGVDISNNFESVGNSQPRRPEMKGPSDISGLLSNIKPKQDMPDSSDKRIIPMKDDSTISAQDIKDINGSKIPNKSNRRKKSEKTSISLDI